MTITVTPELAQAVAVSARTQRTTPETLALSVLRRHFQSDSDAALRRTLSETTHSLVTPWDCYDAAASLTEILEKGLPTQK